MGFIVFVIGFVGGMMITAFIQIVIGNVFVTSFVIGSIMGVLTAKEW